MTTVRVETAAPYDVVVADDARSHVHALLGPDVSRVAVVHPPELAGLAADVSAEIGGRRQAVRIEVPSGERAKTLDVARYCWDVLGTCGFTRSDVIIALGGGATTDLAGFVASAWLRGIGLISMPTTVLAMVDAAVGGKTGINTGAGKNLVGAFYEPRGVLCDVGTLRSLPYAEIRSGAGEIVKCGFIRDPGILDLIASAPQLALDPAKAVLPELIVRGIRVKAQTVAADLTERVRGGDDIGRESLNYGHTLGHAIERLERYAVRHGDAISVGMVFAAELAFLAGSIDEDLVTRHRTILGMLGLPLSYRPDAYAAALEVMRVDKKTRGTTMRFVILEQLAQPRILAGPDETLIAEAFRRVSQ